jgi:hypothetical protein
VFVHIENDYKLLAIFVNSPTASSSLTIVDDGRGDMCTGDLNLYHSALPIILSLIGEYAGMEVWAGEQREVMRSLLATANSYWLLAAGFVERTRESSGF